MLYTYQFHPFAQKEYEDSIIWYAVRSTKIAEDFVNSISKELTKICKNPQINKNEYRHYFEKVTRRYPFTIIYTIEEEIKSVVIIAIFHQKREPLQKYR